MYPHWLDTSTSFSFDGIGGSVDRYWQKKLMQFSVDAVYVHNFCWAAQLVSIHV